MSVTETPVRKYVLTRVSAGDYLFPSNDGQTLWRVYRYDEDGLDSFGDAHGVVGTFWACASFDGSMPTVERLMQHDPAELLSWHRWVCHTTAMRTRTEAIAGAMRAA